MHTSTTACTAQATHGPPSLLCFPPDARTIFPGGGHMAEWSLWICRHICVHVVLPSNRRTSAAHTEAWRTRSAYAFARRSSVVCVCERDLSECTRSDNWWNSLRAAVRWEKVVWCLVQKAEGRRRKVRAQETRKKKEKEEEKEGKRGKLRRWIWNLNIRKTVKKSHFSFF